MYPVSGTATSAHIRTYHRNAYGMSIPVCIKASSSHCRVHYRVSEILAEFINSAPISEEADFKERPLWMLLETGSK